jgi:hypothetical protein
MIYLFFLGSFFFGIHNFINYYFKLIYEKEINKKCIVDLVKSKIQKFKFIKVNLNLENKIPIFFSNFFLFLSYISSVILLIIPFFFKYFSKEFLEFLAP